MAGIVPRRFCLIAFFLVLQACLAEDKADLNLKAFEATVGFANTLTGWAFAILAGSILAIVGTGYFRPQSLKVRCAYLTFIPGWVMLGISIVHGTRVQTVYLAGLMSASHDWRKLMEPLNDDVGSQLFFMKMGLLCFGVWLIGYLAWWIFHSEPPVLTKKEVSQP